MATKIFVGSLPSGCKPEELRHLFEAYGVVTECDVMNRCGFVHMEKPEMAETAIKALNSTEFKGETINVEPGRVRERNQKPGGIGGVKGAGPGKGPRGGRRMQNFDGIDERAMGLEGIDERTTKDALQLCSAVFEEMNKLLNPNQGGGPRRGGGRGGMGFPQNFVENQLEAVMGGMGGPRGPMNRGPRNRNNGPPIAAPVQGPVNRPPVKKNVPAPKVVAPVPANVPRGPKQGPAQTGPQGRGPNAGRVQNQGNQVFAGRNQNQVNAGRPPKQGNVGPIRPEPARPRRISAPYNRGPVGRIDNDINFADDVPIVQSARNFANNLATGSQIDRWPENGGSFGGNARGGNMNSHAMNRNFDEDMPVNNFVDDDLPIVINMVTRGSGGGGGAGIGGGRMGRGVGMGDGGGRGGGIGNQGNFGHNTGGGNDRFQGGNNERFQNSNNNDRFQGGNSGGGGGNFGMGNQDRRGFALPERQMFNDNPKFGNQDQRSERNSSFGGGQNNQGSMGGGNRNFGNNNVNRQQNIPEIRNMGGGNLGGSGGNAIFARRSNNQGGNLDGNNMGNNRMRNDVPDTNRGGNFGGNNNRGMGGGGGGGGGSNNNAGFNRNNNMGGGMSNLHGPIGGNKNLGGGGGLNNRNMGGGAANNRNMGGGAVNNRNMGGNVANNNRNMGGGMANNRNMGGGNTGNNMNRMGGGGNQINPLNFQKDFPALSGGQNMNNRNGPRQNMMSNRRFN